MTIADIPRINGLEAQRDELLVAHREVVRISVAYGAKLGPDWHKAVQEMSQTAHAAIKRVTPAFMDDVRPLRSVPHLKPIIESICRDRGVTPEQAKDA